ncbi:MAG: hypothetical protein M5U09_28185 [Gammaproteobacteria bacterium]|nr:hypothetical protein [Gammaproteobacteria bacterium]
MRCYNPKPVVAVEFAGSSTDHRAAKFHFSTALADVHTVAPPWTWVDYDFPRPGAGSVLGDVLRLAEILLMQKAAWDGPVYSEGGHVYYTGLADGNYGQDQAYKFLERPWLVDSILPESITWAAARDGQSRHVYGRDFDMGTTVQAARSLESTTFLAPPLPSDIWLPGHGGRRR